MPDLSIGRPDSGQPPGVQEHQRLCAERCPGYELRLFDPQPDDATLADIYKQEYYNAWGPHC
jgi:hypothetical protein